MEIQPTTPTQPIKSNKEMNNVYDQEHTDSDEKAYQDYMEYINSDEYRFADRGQDDYDPDAYERWCELNDYSDRESIELQVST